ncbi:MAG: ribonuclease, partial [Bacteroidota bacterium]
MDIIVFILVGLLIGLTLGYLAFVVMRKQQLEKERSSIIEEAKLQGENLKKDRILEAKEKYMQLRSEYEKETNRRSQEMNNAENRLKQKEQSLDDKLRAAKTKEEETQKTKERLDAQIENYKTKEREITQLRDQQLEQLQKVAGLSADDAKAQMLETIRAKSHTEGLSLAKNIVEEAKLSATREAKRIVLQTIQRTAAETAIDNTVPSFPLENDDVKGRIIGREGRNIKAFEAATGVEILIDDTP